jgi:hypothetical protein
MTTTAEPTPKLVPRQPGLWNLIQFLIEVAKGQRYLTLTITFQRGQIERIHVDESFTLETLPVKDKARVEQLRASGSLAPANLQG